DRRLGNSSSALRVGPRLFILALRRDVLYLPDEINRLARGVMNSGYAERHPDHRTVLANVSLDPLIAGDLATDESLQLLEIHRNVLGVGDVGESQIQQLFLRVPEHLAKRPICLYEPALGVDE